MTTNIISNDTLSYLDFISPQLSDSYMYDLQWPHPFIAGRLSIGDYKHQLYARLLQVMLATVRLVTWHLSQGSSSAPMAASQISL